jgi:hypothetical protein
MAKGKKTDTELVYEIMVSYFALNNYAEVSRKLEVPLTTVYDTVERNKDKPEFEKLRNEINEQFSVKATRLIDKALNRIDTELDSPDKIPVNQLSTVVGTLFDKVRLDKGESTENTKQTITIGFSDEIQELSK